MGIQVFMHVTDLSPEESSPWPGPIFFVSFFFFGFNVEDGNLNSGLHECSLNERQEKQVQSTSWISCVTLRQPLTMSDLILKPE